MSRIRSGARAQSIADSGFDLKVGANGVCHPEASTPHSLALILADYDAISGAWVSGYLYIRSAREAIEIRFLIDTGAALTCVAAGELLPA